ncbi:MAG TPA: carboxynorspermidine decarboxylase, partial [Candidatus Omnitrophota bacterium]|nr:carboxynorspermidine decarboxylase [Candidatus Omnitrophota bacterium]
KKLLKNLEMIKFVREHSGAKCVLALKCFSTWGVFGLMKKYLDGTTSSAPYESRLGYEKMGKEVHSYSVGYTREDMEEIAPISDKIIFNSISQLKSLAPFAGKAKLGLRINPGVSFSHFDLANPARRYSRLGEKDKRSILKVAEKITGVMFHFNCENDDFNNFSKNLDHISREYGDIISGLEWVSLGGGIYFTKEGYRLRDLCEKLKKFSSHFNVQVYLEPGESVVTRSTELVTSVVDIMKNEIDIAIVDASTEAHMLDLLIYRIDAKLDDKEKGLFKYMIAGRSCLAGDVFGTYSLRKRLKVGSVVRFQDAGGYTMVKKNWFNGLKMPAIVIKRLDGSLNVVRRFTYKDFKDSLS